MSRHPVVIAAPRGLAAGSAPYLVERDEPDFISAVLAEIGSLGTGDQLSSTRAVARDAGGRLKLFQPVQRKFHLALLEAWCDTPGAPRLDPAKVLEGGLVVRRLGPQGEVEGWMKADGRLRGWVPVDRIGGDAVDPRPSARAALKATGVVSLDRALRALDATRESAVLEEESTPLFVAPPDVCEASGRTVLYGVVPTASAELAETPADAGVAFAGFGSESTAFIEHLVQPLRGLAYTFPAPPLAGRRFDAGWLETLMAASLNSAEHRFLGLLRQVAVEFDAFGDSASARALHERLRGITLEYALREHEELRRTVSAADFLHDAVRVVLEGEAGTVEMPERWPALAEEDAVALRASMSGAVHERFRGVVGREGRFDDGEATYLLRAFVRLRGECGCPPRTVWSGYSEPFSIAPWYETAAAPVRIALPDLSDPALLRSLRPNVAFAVPPALQGLLSASPKDLMEGRGGEPSAIGWICCFSIPVITLCAFIVLNIFLTLFDLIFRWLMFIKICIPYPKAK